MNLFRARFISRFGPWILLAGFLVALGTSLAWPLWQLRSDLEFQEKDRLATQVRVAQTILGRQLEATHAAMETVRTDLEFLTAQRDASNLLSLRLLALSNASLGIRTFNVLDRRGNVIGSNRKELMGRNFADRPYFTQALQTLDPSKLHVSEPFRTVLGVFSLNLVSTVLDAKGEFQGVISVTIDPEYFSTTMEAVRYASDMWVRMVHGRGMLFIQTPQRADLLGTRLDMEDSLVSRHLASGQAATVITGVVITTGEVSFVAQHTLAPAKLAMDHSLVLAVGRSVEDVYAEWWHDVLFRGGLFGLIAVLSASAVVAYQLRRFAYDRLLAQQLAERKEALLGLRIAATAFESQEGIFVTNNLSVILRVNQAFTEITGYTPEDAIGQTPRLFRSDRHGPDFYLEMWTSIKNTGLWRGEIWNRRKNGELFIEWLTITAVRDDQGSITNYVANFVDITSRKDAEEKIQKLAFYDPLTNLPNRRLLIDRLEHTLRSYARQMQHGALIFIDLDNFKTLNDTRGHHIGDLLLELVSTRLLEVVRTGDTVARLGGDEFVVMLENLSDDKVEAAQQAETVGGKVLDALNHPYELENIVHHVSPSIGVTLFGAGVIEDVHEPLKRADLAMYQAKAAGRNAIRFYDTKVQTLMQSRVALEASLRMGLEREEFQLYYQPQVDSEAKIIGAEVLLRWPHPQRGMVSPAEFIPLAEETGLIIPLGLWVMNQACRQLALWGHQPHVSSLVLSVNVSARQIAQTGFVEQVLGALRKYGARAERLKLELTESMLVSNVEDTIAKMNALRAFGVGLSLDDFGTGYSSLSYLKRLPLDQLKVDQGFVRDLLVDNNDAAIAQMVIALGGSLSLRVIAEGVETEAQREALAKMGCHAYQGYLYGRPMPLHEFESLHLGMSEF